MQLSYRVVFEKRGVVGDGEGEEKVRDEKPGLVSEE